jgi:imidazolonepropionase-like amidohydrolase
LQDDYCHAHGNPSAPAARCGDRELLQDRAVVIDGNRIAGVVAAGDAPAEGPAFVDLPGQTVLPGMIDCHTHLVGEPDGSHGPAELLARTSAQDALAGARNARDTLLAGFTTARDMGTFRAFVDVALRDAIDAGWVAGPRMLAPGAYVTCSGGAATLPGWRPKVDAVVPHEFRVGVADSVDDIRRAVRRVLHGGADFVKLIATGAPELTEEQIRAAVEEASLYGADVAAHAHGAWPTGKWTTRWRAASWRTCRRSWRAEGERADYPAGTTVYRAGDVPRAAPGGPRVTAGAGGCGRVGP